MNQEKPISVLNGWAMVGVNFAIFVAGIGSIWWTIAYAIENSRRMPDQFPWFALVAGVLLIGLGIFVAFGFFTQRDC